MKKSLILLLTIGFILTLPIKRVEAVYESYINNIPQPVSITSETQDAQKELEAKVQEMVNAGHMAPTLYFVGLGGNPIIFYTSPVETIYTLSAAYPYLSSTLKAQVKTYLDNEISNYPPHSTAFYPTTNPNGNAAGTVSQQTGARREYFTPNPNEPFSYWYRDPPGANNWIAPHVNIAVLYAIWVYSNNTNDWTYVANNYTALRNIYTTFKPSGINTYAELSGVIGFARIAQHQGQTADYNDALAFADTGFTNGVNFGQFLSTAKTRFPNAYNLYYWGDAPNQSLDYGYTTPIFMFQRNPEGLLFNKDIGIFLKDNASVAAASYSAQIVEDMPLGWLTAPGLSHSESSYDTPEIPWTYFMLHSYVLGDSISQLKTLLDKPDRKGDLLYMQKLIAIIEAGSTSSTIPTLTPTPTSTQTSPPTPKLS